MVCRACGVSASVVRVVCKQRGFAFGKKQCVRAERGAKAEREVQKRSRWSRWCLTMVWCEHGESVKAEREERKQMVRACVERRERKREERKQMVCACVERAWCERGKQIREVLCVLYAPTLFLCFALFGYGITQEPTE